MKNILPFSYSHCIYILLTIAGTAACLESCSAPAAASAAVASWYEETLYEGKPFYVTKNAVSWKSGRKNADFGHWTAVSVYDPCLLYTSDAADE